MLARRFSAGVGLLRQLPLQVPLQPQQELYPGKAVEAQFPVEIAVQMDIEVRALRRQLHHERADNAEQPCGQRLLVIC